jgi:hypothetical protein
VVSIQLTIHWSAIRAHPFNERIELSDVLDDVSDISDGDIPDVPDKDIDEDFDQADVKQGEQRKMPVRNTPAVIMRLFHSTNRVKA